MSLRRSLRQAESFDHLFVCLFIRSVMFPVAVNHGSQSLSRSDSAPPSFSFKQRCKVFSKSTIREYCSENVVGRCLFHRQYQLNSPQLDSSHLFLCFHWQQKVAYNWYRVPGTFFSSTSVPSEGDTDQRFAVSFLSRSFPRTWVSPQSTLPYDNNRRAAIAFFILFPIITFPGNQVIILFRFRIPGFPSPGIRKLKPNDDLGFFFTTHPHWRGTFLDGNATCLEPNQVVMH